MAQHRPEVPGPRGGTGLSTASTMIGGSLTALDIRLRRPPSAGRALVDKLLALGAVVLASAVS